MPVISPKVSSDLVKSGETTPMATMASYLLFFKAVKTFIDSPVNDVICLIVEKAIPGEIDDILIEKAKNILRNVLPKVLLSMSLINEIESTTDPVIKEKKLNIILLMVK